MFHTQPQVWWKSVTIWGMDNKEIFLLKSIVVNKDFQIWHLIGKQHSHKPIRSHVKNSLLNNMDINMDFT